MDDHADVIAEFCNITGSEPSVAESFLAAHEFNLERSLDTFFRDEPAFPGPAGPAPFQQNEGAPTAAMDAAAGWWAARYTTRLRPHQ